MPEKLNLHFSTNYDSEDSLEILDQIEQENKLVRLAKGDILFERQMEIAQGNVLEAKKALCLNSNINPSVQRYLVQNSKTCHLWLSKNPYTAEDVIVTMASNDNPEVLQNILNRKFVSWDIQKALMQSASVLRNGYDGHKIHSKLAQCKNLYNSVLKELLDIEDIDVLFNLSKNESLPECYSYLKFFFDEESIIPENVLEIIMKQSSQLRFRLIAKNKNIPAFFQKFLFENGNEDVLLELIQNSNFDKDLQIEFVMNYPDINETITNQIESDIDGICESELPHTKVTGLLTLRGRESANAKARTEP